MKFLFIKKFTHERYKEASLETFQTMTENHALISKLSQESLASLKSSPEPSSGINSMISTITPPSPLLTPRQEYLLAQEVPYDIQDDEDIDLESLFADEDPLEEDIDPDSLFTDEDSLEIANLLDSIDSSPLPQRPMDPIFLDKKAPDNTIEELELPEETRHSSNILIEETNGFKRVSFPTEVLALDLEGLLASPELRMHDRLHDFELKKLHKALQDETNVKKLADWTKRLNNNPSTQELHLIQQEIQTFINAHISMKDLLKVAASELIHSAKTSSKKKIAWDVSRFVARAGLAPVITLYVLGKMVMQKKARRSALHSLSKLLHPSRLSYKDREKIASVLLRVGIGSLASAFVASNILGGGTPAAAILATFAICAGLGLAGNLVNDFHAKKHPAVSLGNVTKTAVEGAISGAISGATLAGVAKGIMNSHHETHSSGHENSADSSLAINLTKESTGLHTTVEHVAESIAHGTHAGGFAAEHLEETLLATIPPLALAVEASYNHNGRVEQVTSLEHLEYYDDLHEATKEIQNDPHLGASPAEAFEEHPFVH